MRYLCDRNPIPVNRCKTIDYLAEEEGAFLCHICQCIAPYKAKHCYHCGRCCLDYDHHCVFLFSCIGRHNVWAFMSFTFMLAVCGLHGIAVILSVTLDEIRANPWYKHFFKQGFFSMRTMDELYYSVGFYHFLNLTLCLKFIMLGGALGTVTLFKWRQFTRIRKRHNIGNGTSSRVVYF